EVSALPFQHSRFPEPGFDAFNTSIARLSPASVIRKARPIISISLSDLASRSGQKNPSAARTRILFAASSSAYASGKFAGTVADLTPRFFRKWVSTFSYGGAFLDF